MNLRTPPRKNPQRPPDPTPDPLSPITKETVRELSGRDPQTGKPVQP